MGDFEDHMRWAFGAHIVTVLGIGVAISVYSLPLLFVGVAATGLPLTLIGGAFPDIDHHASKPNRIFKNALTVGAAVCSGYFAVTAGGTLLSATGATYGVPTTPSLAIGGTTTALVTGAAARKGFSVVRPRHRGVTHRVPTGTIVSAAVGAVVTVALAGSPEPVKPALFGGLSAILFFAGVLSHLACDGMLTSLDTYLSFR